MRGSRGGGEFGSPLPHQLNNKKIEIVFMKHCAPNHMLVHKDDLTR